MDHLSDFGLVLSGRGPNDLAKKSKFFRVENITVLTLPGFGLNEPLTHTLNKLQNYYKMNRITIKKILLIKKNIVD